KHCVRVFVADVMGHGARSALMTAILHALISDTAKADSDPSHLLQRMNKEFYDIGQRTGDTLFVTAIHLIIDTRLRTIRYAVAGHPSPLIIDHASGNVELLIPEDQPAPAAGLLPDTVYSGMERKIEKEQSILLYTDGVTEARNPQDEEFGTDRLIQTVKVCCETGRKASLPKYVLEILESYMNTAVAMDDICLVAIDILKARKR
ncbi:MAG TPA: PP2C family protein-serine/threonine phosphatase, partial [Pontiella sp.]|nr:PP2C family protein-serine/threonine phosphatase [Pontiella sp.]